LFTPYDKNPIYLLSDDKIKEMSDYFLGRRDKGIKAITPFSLSCKGSRTRQEELMAHISVFAEHAPNICERYDYWTENDQSKTN
jgi:hypothetical protein